MRENGDLDRLLDSVLSTYGDPGPGSGLDQRVLASIRTRIAAEPAPRRRWLPWAVGLPAAACLLLFFLAGPKTAHSPAIPAKVVTQPQEFPITTAHTGPLPALRPQLVPRTRQVPFSRQSRPGGHATRSVALPKLDVFPTPQPLTQAEQALVAFAVRAPEAERQSLIAAQKQAEAPLSIAAIEIPPIESPDKGTN